MAITRSFKGLWVETWVPLPTHTHSAFSCLLLYSTVKRKKKKEEKKATSINCNFSLHLGFWRGKMHAQKTRRSCTDTAGDKHFTYSKKNVHILPSFPPHVRCCFSKASFISKSKRSVNRRQNSDVCTLHPQQIKLILSSRNAPFFAFLPFHSALLAVRRGQLQPDESTSQMKAPRHPHAAEIYTSHGPSPYVGREICPWQEHQPVYKSKFHFNLELPSSGFTANSANWKSIHPPLKLVMLHEVCSTGLLVIGKEQVYTSINLARRKKTLDGKSQIPCQ